MCDKNSCIIAAAAIDVICVGSYGGETSTTSYPTILRSFKPLIISNACAVENPPGTGVPVPGA